MVAVSTSPQSLLPQKSLNLNLHSHRLQPQLRNPNLSPNRMMISPTPLLEISDHSSRRVLVQRQVVASDAIDLAPAFAASSFQGQIDIRERLVDLGVEVLRDPGRGGGEVGVRVPAAWRCGLRLVVEVGRCGDGRRV